MTLNRRIEDELKLDNSLGTPTLLKYRGTAVQFRSLVAYLRPSKLLIHYMPYNTNWNYLNQCNDAITTTGKQKDWHEPSIGHLLSFKQAATGWKHPKEIADIGVTYITVPFNGSFSKPTIYRQLAGSGYDVDKAWIALGVDLRPVSIPAKDGPKFGLHKGQVKS
ncbi:hypothetical protein BT63DRAFT_451851 [Microthyrium microscopicum]|uniref:Uncharacterized protein n=1 Tax=Microthyrium microscopicum TaxID=703497 RepID=A0A6A6UND9_9PEZI|nr:hypothetical protein BT63DRAFT_451851 [Microthyrium microscopicum]